MIAWRPNSHGQGALADESAIAFERLGDGEPVIVAELMMDTGRQIAQAMPNGRLRVLEGRDHVVAPEPLAPVLLNFLTAAERTTDARRPVPRPRFRQGA